MTDDPRAAFEQALYNSPRFTRVDAVVMREITATAIACHEQLLKSAPPAEGPTWQQVEAVLRDLEDRNGYWALTPSQVDAALFLMGKRPTPPRDQAGKE
jgi:hypothetical protein